MNGKQIVKKLESLGWKLDRVSGSHHVMKKEGRKRPVPIPVHGSTDFSKSLLSAIERQTGEKLK